MTELERKALLHVEKLLDNTNSYPIYKKFVELMQLHEIDFNQISILWKELETVINSDVTLQINEARSWIKSLLTTSSK